MKTRRKRRLEVWLFPWGSSLFASGELVRPRVCRVQKQPVSEVRKGVSTALTDVIGGRGLPASTLSTWSIRSLKMMALKCRSCRCDYT